jgi:hypothetical protein
MDFSVFNKNMPGEDIKYKTALNTEERVQKKTGQSPAKSFYCL